MTGCAARRLCENHSHFDDEADDGHVGRETREARAALDKAEQPNKSEAVDADGDGELGRFQPCRRTCNDAMIDQDPRKSCEKNENHHEAEHRQWPVCLPCAPQKGLAWILRSECMLRRPVD